VEVGLKLLMQLVGGLSAALLAAGNKVLAEDGAVSVDNDKGEGGGFLDGVTTYWGWVLVPCPA
jgi:hypothetical protein